MTTAASKTVEKGAQLDQWLADAKICLSPNHDERPEKTNVDLLVIHNISLPPGKYGGQYIENFFLNQLNPKDHPYFADIHQIQVSAHLLIKRNGDIIQFVPFNKRAWHAGVSAFKGKCRCNDFSIGIEMEGCDQDNFTEMQYRVLTGVTHQIQKLYPLIEKGRIVGHQEIAPERKTDPGPHFDWQRYFSSL